VVKFTDPSSLQLNKTLARQLVPLADQLRDMLTQFGLRPYKVRIVRTQWSGGERGIGVPVVVKETDILPTPLLSDLTTLTEIVQPVGLDEIGMVTLSEVSGRFTEDDLMGRDSDGAPIPADQEFFYEVEFPRLDGLPGVRRRFFPRSAPQYDAGGLQWVVRMEKTHEDRDRAGDPR
jgi:hypothetical protein